MFKKLMFTVVVLTVIMMIGGLVFAHHLQPRNANSPPVIIMNALSTMENSPLSVNYAAGFETAIANDHTYDVLTSRFAEMSNCLVANILAIPATNYVNSQSLCETELTMARFESPPNFTEDVFGSEKFGTFGGFYIGNVAEPIVYVTATNQKDLSGMTKWNSPLENMKDIFGFRTVEGNFGLFGGYYIGD